MNGETDTRVVVSATPSAARRRLLWRTWSTRSLLLYGLVVAMLGTALLYTAAPKSWPIESSRAASLQGALLELDSGGPPLWGKYPTHVAGSPHVAGSQSGQSSFNYGPTSSGDDQGAFFYVPGLAHILGLHHALSAMRFLYLALFFVPILLYPLLFARLFSSTAAGLIAPWGLVLCLRGLAFIDILWTTEWAVLALLPPLMLLDRHWHRWGLASLLLVVIGASFANSVRAQAGLGVALAALIVVLRRPWRWRWRLATVPLLVVAYLSISTFGLNGLRAWRDATLGHSFHDASSSHLVWHPIFLGLGYMPNRYGLHWDDATAAAVVHAYRPSAQYPTAAYEAAVRHVFLRLVERDPGLLARSVAAKLLVVLRFGDPALVVLLLIGVVAAAGRQRASPLLRSLVLLVPALLASLVPPLLGVPALAYQLGWLAALGLGCILGAAWLAAQLHPWRDGDNVHSLAELRRTIRAWLGSSRLRAAAIPAIIAVLVVIRIAGNLVIERAASWRAATPAVPSVRGVLADSR
ncbi:MAG TPA: hypothetical protein VK672_07845 [Solirubrobacteraceae bacterium]|jgi:hypothetical protein|nr:hypothetical protein [Solirubrobacteraceae bacterium]